MVISFPARRVVRRYAIDTAPLARAQLTPGQWVHGNGMEFRVEEVIEADVLIYRGEGMELRETDLDAELDVATPENRMRTAEVDEHPLFDLRKDALDVRHRMLSSPARGFLGGRIRLFDHQLSIARDVCERHRVRVLLADEVGLGKTIEALLILHRMLLSGRIERALVIVPPALVHQWLAEAYLKFNLILRVIGRDTLGGGTIDPESDDLPSELLSAQLFVCPLGIATGDAFLETDWDFVIVDEAHHLEPDSDDFELVAALARRIDHVVLLSATPDRDGESAHFQRLALLDPARFHDEEAYRREAANYRDLADTSERLQRGDALTDADREVLRDRLDSDDLDELLDAADADRDAQRTLLRRLLDLHGIGRVMFRNVRARIPGFPRRVSCPVDLADGKVDRLRREFLHDIGRDDSFRYSSVESDPRLAWLSGFLDEHPNEKVLVLCSTRGKVEAFAGALEARKVEVARFHEEMSSIERDRQAAWFLSDDGPRLLISSSIGAEGRNFQVARNLVLLDLPLHADRLEQLIGRVDRIGQGEEIRVHVPTTPGTPQHRLRRWHQDALSVFDRPWHGSPVIDREFGDALLDAVLDKSDDAVDELIGRGHDRNEQIVKELESGRDRLLELTSFDVDAARELRSAIAAAEQQRELDHFMLDAFERGGLDVEGIGGRSYMVRIGPAYTRPFPGFLGQEMAVTFDRDTGLDHPERTLLSWDHPMVRDTLDSLLARESGNATVARLPSDTPGMFLEVVYVAEPTSQQELRADRFFPPTPVRVVVDAHGDESELDEDALRERLLPIDAGLLKLPQVAQRLPELLDSARSIATARAPAIADDARSRMRHELAPTLERLSELASTNPAIGEPELENARAQLAALDQGLARVRVRLDAIRLIAVTT